MLSDTRAACVATALALCLKQEKNCHWIRVAQRKPHYKHENLMADVMMSGPKYFPPPPRMDSPSFDELLGLLPLTIAIRNTCET